MYYFNFKNIDIIISISLNLNDTHSIDTMRIIEQDITDLDLIEDNLYDFDRPEQSPDKLIHQLSDSIVTRPDRKYIDDLTIELGNL
jgi:hypothetical protein